MKIVLVSPPNIHFQDQGEVNLVEPLGIAYIGAVLENDGHEIRILDADTLRYSVEESVEYIVNEEPEIVGYSCLSPLAPIALRIAAGVKKHIDTVSVFGGVHPTTFPQMAENDYVDFLIVGEGEFAFSQLATAIAMKKDWTNIPGLYFKKDGDINNTGPAERIMDLDSLPFPARHLLPMGEYRYSFPILPKEGTVYASIQASRGCPYKCIFCSSPAQWESLVRFRSPDSIVAELQHLKNDYGVNTFYIRDEVFTLNKKKVFRLCEEMVEADLGMSWFCYARADHVTKELIEAMREAGCILVKVGVESGDDKILERIKKGETRNDMREAFKILNSIPGLYTHASFMIGHPWDTQESVRNTIEFAKELNADTTVFPISTPFPGTELWNIAKKENLLLTEDFQQYGYVGTTVAKTLYLEPDELVKLEHKALIEYYFRPAYIWKALKRIYQKPSAIKMYFRPLRTLMKWLYYSSNLCSASYGSRFESWVGHSKAETFP